MGVIFTVTSINSATHAASTSTDFLGILNVVVLKPVERIHNFSSSASTHGHRHYHHRHNDHADQ